MRKAIDCRTQPTSEMDVYYPAGYFTFHHSRTQMGISRKPATLGELKDERTINQQCLSFEATELATSTRHAIDRQPRAIDSDRAGDARDMSSDAIDSFVSIAGMDDMLRCIDRDVSDARCETLDDIRLLVRLEEKGHVNLYTGKARYLNQNYGPCDSNQDNSPVFDFVRDVINFVPREKLHSIEPHTEELLYEKAIMSQIATGSLSESTDLTEEELESNHQVSFFAKGIGFSSPSMKSIDFASSPKCRYAEVGSFRTEPVLLAYHTFSNDVSNIQKKSENSLVRNYSKISHQEKLQNMNTSSIKPNLRKPESKSSFSEIYLHQHSSEARKYSCRPY